MDLSDAELVDRILGGRTDLYGEIIRRHQKDVWKVVAAALHDFKTAEELVHQAFVNAYLHLDRFDRGAGFAVWVKAIARNLVRHALRSRSRENRLMELYGEHLGARFSDEAAAAGNDDAVAEALQMCCESLPERGAEVLDLRYGQARGFAEIAALLGSTVEAARQHLYRLRLALRDCVEKRLFRS